MRRSFKIGLAAATLFGVMAAAAPVHAVTSDDGWDEVPQVVTGGGSDTTYLIMQRLETLFNGAPGCTMQTGTTSASKGLCNPAGQTVGNGNHDHDVFVGAAPLGSSAGINALLPTGVQNNPPIQYARSSRVPNSTELASVTGWGYARDAIAILSFGTRTDYKLDQATMKDIYTCVKTDWSQVDTDSTTAGVQAGAPGTILPWTMNAASGTRSSFEVTYLGLASNALDGFTYDPAVGPSPGKCVRSLTGGAYPFENDVKPILGDVNTTTTNVNDMIWWMSYGNWKTYPYTKNGSVSGTPVVTNLVAMDGTGTPSDSSISGNTYSANLLRTLYHVTKNTDADCVDPSLPAPPAGTCNNTGPEVYGADTGTGGAVQEFTEFLCRTSNTQQAVNPVTGQGYRSMIVQALNNEGFQQVPVSAGGLRTAGYACQVKT